MTAAALKEKVDAFGRSGLWLAVVQGFFAVVLALISTWTTILVFRVGDIKTDTQVTKDAATEIKHSVNSAQTAMTERSNDLVDKVSKLEEAIKNLLVERAAATPKGEATPSELQSQEPLPKL